MPSIESLSFRRWQADAGQTAVTVFVCQTATMPDGSVVDGPWLSARVELTEAEQIMAQSIIDRAKAQVSAS